MSESHEDHSKVLNQFEARVGRKATAEEEQALKIGARLTIEQVMMAGCMINYPSPDALSSMNFELKHGRKPSAEEVSALKKGRKLSVEDVKMAGCMINYPQGAD